MRSLLWRHGVAVLLLAALPPVAATLVFLTTLESPAQGRALVGLWLPYSSAWLLLAAYLHRTVRGSVRDLKAMSRAASAIEGGDFNAAASAASEDEVGALARAFNRMVVSLEGRLADATTQVLELRALLAHMADAVLVVSADGDILLANEAAGRLFRFTPREAVRRPLVQVVKDYEVVNLVNSSLELHEVRVGEVQLEPQKRFLRLVATPVATQKAETCLLIAQDLTEMRRLETMRREFTSNVSHELRTPLSAIKAMVEVLADSAAEDRELAKDFLSRINGEVDELTGLVDQLLELSRIESGRGGSLVGPVDPKGLVKEGVGRMQPRAERQGVRLEMRLPDSLPPVQGDAARLREVFTNLLDNALKFTPQGGTVTVTLQDMGQEVQVCVADTGIGVKAEDLPRIFERFYKADRSRASTGVGLGLSIVKHIVQVQGGRVWAESEEGRGSRFYVALPKSTRG